MDKLNKYADDLEQAQILIMLIIKHAYLHHDNIGEVSAKIRSTIYNATQGIHIDTLKADAGVALMHYAYTQKRLWESIGLPSEITLDLGAYSAKHFEGDMKLDKALYNEYSRLQPQITALGVPMNKYYEKTWNEAIKPTLEKLAKERALDPNDYTGRNSLRNLAEMEVRYDDHQKSISELRGMGVRLVVASAHADCSERCAPYQGRVYSLDGSSGDIDGHHYVPLEVATDIWYTTKAGRRYKNGLLGFNCRHFITAYSGKLLENISEEERKAQYAITQKQRSMERITREYRATAMMYKDISKADYTRFKRLYNNAYKSYVEYSMANNRAYYPSRVDV